MIFPPSEIFFHCRETLFFISDHCWSISGGIFLGFQGEEELRAHGEREGEGISLVGQVLAKSHALSCRARLFIVAFHLQINLN